MLYFKIVSLYGCYLDQVSLVKEILNLNESSWLNKGKISNADFSSDGAVGLQTVRWARCISSLSAGLVLCCSTSGTAAPQQTHTTCARSWTVSPSHTYTHAFIRVPTGFGKVWKNKARVWKNICVSRLLHLFSFLIIENSEFNENKFIVQEVRFHGSCLVIAKYD